jgi:hypothetical protein
LINKLTNEKSASKYWMTQGKVTGNQDHGGGAVEAAGDSRSIWL